MQFKMLVFQESCTHGFSGVPIAGGVEAAAGWSGCITNGRRGAPDAADLGRRAVGVGVSKNTSSVRESSTLAGV